MCHQRFLCTHQTPNVKWQWVWKDKEIIYQNMFLGFIHVLQNTFDLHDGVNLLSSVYCVSYSVFEPLTHLNLCPSKGHFYRTWWGADICIMSAKHSFQWTGECWVSKHCTIQLSQSLSEESLELEEEEEDSCFLFFCFFPCSLLVFLPFFLWLFSFFFFFLLSSSSDEEYDLSRFFFFFVVSSLLDDEEDLRSK